MLAALDMFCKIFLVVMVSPEINWVKTKTGMEKEVRHQDLEDETEV